MASDPDGSERSILSQSDLRSLFRLQVNSFFVVSNLYKDPIHFHRFGFTYCTYRYCIKPDYPMPFGLQVNNACDSLRLQPFNLAFGFWERQEIAGKNSIEGRDGTTNHGYMPTLLKGSQSSPAQGTSDQFSLRTGILLPISIFQNMKSLQCLRQGRTIGPAEVVPMEAHSTKSPTTASL